MGPRPAEVGKNLTAAFGQAMAPWAGARTGGLSTENRGTPCGKNVPAGDGSQHQPAGSGDLHQRGAGAGDKLNFHGHELGRASPSGSRRRALVNSLASPDQPECAAPAPAPGSSKACSVRIARGRRPSRTARRSSRRPDWSCYGGTVTSTPALSVARGEHGGEVRGAERARRGGVAGWSLTSAPMAVYR